MDRTLFPPEKKEKWRLRRPVWRQCGTTIKVDGICISDKEHETFWPDDEMLPRSIFDTRWERWMVDTEEKFAVSFIPHSWSFAAWAPRAGCRRREIKMFLTRLQPRADHATAGTVACLCDIFYKKTREREIDVPNAVTDRQQSGRGDTFDDGFCYI